MNDDTVHVLDFEGCSWIVKFLERCGACDRKECIYRNKLIDVLMNRKRLEFGNRLSDKGRWSLNFAGDPCPLCKNKLDSGHMFVFCKKCGFKLDF